MRKYLSVNLDFDFTMSELKDAQNAVLVPEDNSGVRMMSETAAGMGLEARPSQVAFGSDAFRMNAAGIPTVLWGPGSIRTAHTDGEYVAIEDVEMAVKFYLELMMEGRMA